jgi:hypothetical protein
MFKHPKTKPLVASIMLLFLLVFTVNLSSAQLPLKVTVVTDKDFYQLRELVNIYGNVTYNDNPVPNGLVAVQVEAQSKTIVARTVPANNTVPVQDWNVEIVSIIPCDESGNLKTTFIRTGYAYFKVTIRNNNLFAQTIKRIVNIYDNVMMPLDIAADTYDIAPKTTDSSILRFTIPEWASVGNATAYANVYTDWPKNEGRPYCPEKAATFYIVSFEGEEPITKTSNLFSEVNASYQTGFRLTPFILNQSVYYISVSAFYSGWTAFKSNLFSVEYHHNQTIPRASFAHWPPQAGPGVKIAFDASSSTAEGYNDNITIYKWDFGDNITFTSTLAFANHTYPTKGNYTVTLNVTDTQGLWNTTSEKLEVATIRDIAILKIECLNEIYSDWTATVKITVKNKGTTPETFNVTTYYDSFTINKVTNITLGPSSQSIVTVLWSTTGLTPYQSYTLWAEASLVPNEINTTNNVLTFGAIYVKMLGDIDGNKKIDIYDIVLITSIYGSKTGDPLWNPQVDLNPDGVINIYDVVAATSNYGYKYV